MKVRVTLYHNVFNPYGVGYLEVNHTYGTLIGSHKRFFFFGKHIGIIKTYDDNIIEAPMDDIEFISKREYNDSINKLMDWERW